MLASGSPPSPPLGVHTLGDGCRGNSGVLSPQGVSGGRPSPATRTAKSQNVVSLLGNGVPGSHPGAVGSSEGGRGLPVTVAEAAGAQSARRDRTAGCALPSPPSAKGKGGCSAAQGAGWAAQQCLPGAGEPAPPALTGARPGHSYTVKSPSSFSSSEEADSSSLGGSLCLWDERPVLPTLRGQGPRRGVGAQPPWPWPCGGRGGGLWGRWAGPGVGSAGPGAGVPSGAASHRSRHRICCLWCW